MIQLTAYREGIKIEMHLSGSQDQHREKVLDCWEESFPGEMGR